MTLKPNQAPPNSSATTPQPPSADVLRALPVISLRMWCFAHVHASQGDGEARPWLSPRERHLLLTFWSELPTSKLLKWARNVLKKDRYCTNVSETHPVGSGPFLWFPSYFAFYGHGPTGQRLGFKYLIYFSYAIQPV